MHYWMDVGFIRPAQRDEKKGININYSDAPAPLLEILFLFSILNWIRSLGGMVVVEHKEGGALRSHRSDFKGNIDLRYGSTEMDPEGYPSVNNGSVRWAASPLNHRWAVITSGLSLNICTVTCRCVYVCLCVCFSSIKYTEKNKT